MNADEFFIGHPADYRKGEIMYLFTIKGNI
jgi:hypothetical protein